MTPPAARLFERLALHSGTFCLHLAAVTAGTSVHRVRMLLDELTDAHLVVESGTGEFAMHTVVGRFGRRLACAEEWTAPTWGNPTVAGCLECDRSGAALPGPVGVLV